MNDYFQRVKKPVGRFAYTLVGASIIMGSTVSAAPTCNIYDDLTLNKPVNIDSYSNIIENRRSLSRGISHLTANSLDSISDNDNVNINKTVSLTVSSSITVQKENTMHLPDYFLYTDIDEGKLKDYLTIKNSVLADEPYFSEIVATSRSFNLNPLILFAIAGQEQNFVPKYNNNAYTIANNPYNVFHSWQHYNTDIEDSTAIASRTIINLSKDCPNNIDTFTWINKRYASDQNWSKGVRKIYNDLTYIIAN